MNDHDLADEIRSQIQIIKQMREAMSIMPANKRQTEESEEEASQLNNEKIIFTKVNLERVQLTHNDPLVVRLRIHDYMEKRILINSDSSVEVMYYGFFKQLRLSKECLTPSKAPLVGFNGQFH